MNSPGLAAEIDSILQHSACAASMTPEARQLLEEVKQKAGKPLETAAPQVPDLFSPFRRPCPPHWGVPYTEDCSVDDRLHRVRTMSVAELERVVAIGWCIQKTVLLAAERRLRKLRKGAA